MFYEIIPLETSLTAVGKKVLMLRNFINAILPNITSPQ